MKKTLWFAALLAMLVVGLAYGATLKLGQPNGGEELTLGKPYQITWTATGVTQKIKLVLIKSGGALVGIIDSNLDAKSCIYNWTTGQHKGGMAAAGGNYKIRICTMDNTLEDLSDKPFTISQPVPIRKFPEFPLPHPWPPPFGSPKLEVTAIALVPNASGYGIIFGYKNVGNAALPPRHELPVKPDYRVLIDDREIDKGDLFVPESPPAGPGYELKTHSGGFINFPAAGDPVPWNIGKLITITLNERNVLGMGSASKTSSLKAIVLTVGYDLAFGPLTFDWPTCTAHTMITKVGANPQLSKNFNLNWSIRGYHPAENIEHDFNEATVTTSEGPFTDNRSKTIPSSGPFPVHVDLPMGGPYSLFYELKLTIRPEYRDEFDERNNTAPQVRFNRPEIPRGPRIESFTFDVLNDTQGKTRLWFTIALVNRDTVPYSGLRLVLKRNGVKVREITPIEIPAGGRSPQGYIEDQPGGTTFYDAYLYDSRGRLLDAKTTTSIH